MVKLKVGDRINCRLKHSKIVKPDLPFDDEKTFEIIAVDELGYHLFIPNYINIEGSDKIDYYYAKNAGIAEKFLQEEAVYIIESLIHKVYAKLDGSFCKKCHDFYDFAAANQEDEEAFICWHCRNYRFNY